MPYEAPQDPQAARRATIGRWVSFVLVALLVVLLSYFGYVGFVGSDQIVEPVAPSTDCRTPAALGWTYEAINYDRAGDRPLVRLEDPTNCAIRGEPAGDALLTADGYRIAGWYVPRAGPADPTGPTIVLAHGHARNKSAVLEHAALLHPEYNLVLFDFRNHGQSQDASTTVGVLERHDLRAVIDWLEETKGPSAIGVLGVSMGGATAINEARGDQRVRAVILDSTHATLANALQARLQRSGYPLALPGAWSILLGGLLRTGQDMSAADPVQAVEDYGSRPLLIIAAGRDDTMGANDADDLLAAARSGGAQAELEVCAAAAHAQPIQACADEYRDWVLGFLSRALADGS